MNNDYLIARFESRLSEIEDRLKAIETTQRSGEASSTSVTASVTTSGSPVPALTASNSSGSAPSAPGSFNPPPSTPAYFSPNPKLATPSNANARPANDEKPGNWLGIIGVVCFVLAAGFIIKLSIETGWLTPARQVGIAVLFGLSLIGVGLRLLKSDREYASLLPAAGIIVLYLSSFAAHRLYELIPLELALASVGLVSATCIWLYTEIRHDVYAVTAAVGTYASPVILALQRSDDFALYYCLLASLAYATISIWVQSRTLTVVSAYLAIIMTAVTGLGMTEKSDLIASTLLLHFFIFAVGTYFYSRHSKKGLTTNEAWSFFPVLIIFYAAEFHFVSRFAPDQAPWLSLGVAALILGLYISAKNWLADKAVGSQPMIIAITTVILFHSVYLELLPLESRPWLFVAIVLAMAFVPSKSVSSHRDNYKFPIAMIAILLAIEFVSIAFHLVTTKEAGWVLVAMVSLASMWALIVMKSREFFSGENQSQLLLGSAHMLALLGFYRLSADSGSLAVSASWLLYAICVISFAFARKDQIMAKSAIFVLGFAAAKALLYDASSAPTLVRIFCLLLTGAALYGSGFLMRQIANWKPKA